MPVSSTSHENLRQAIFVTDVPIIRFVQRSTPCVLCQQPCYLLHSFSGLLLPFDMMYALNALVDHGACACWRETAQRPLGWTTFEDAGIWGENLHPVRTPAGLLLCVVEIVEEAVHADK